MSATVLLTFDSNGLAVGHKQDIADAFKGGDISFLQEPWLFQAFRFRPERNTLYF
jgi:hypothetical protein